MTHGVTIASGDGWKLDSYGNGAAYVLESPEGEQCFFQYGDESAAFRDEWDALEKARPDAPTAELLGEMWSRYF